MGDHALCAPALVASKDHQQLTGSGLGTRSYGSRTGFVFETCASGRAQSLVVATSYVPRPSAARRPHASGTLTFGNCPAVNISRMRLVTCLRVRNAVESPGTVRGRYCTLPTGQRQPGIVPLHVTTVLVEANPLWP